LIHAAFFQKNKNLIAMIESNFNDASSSDPWKNSPTCSRTRNYVALNRLIKDIVQDKHTQIEKKNKNKKPPIRMNLNGTFTRKMLQEETSSRFFLLAESRYKTSENPLLFALAIAFKT
jgi:hypothetical protein